MAKAMCIRDCFDGPATRRYMRNSGPHEIDPKSAVAKYFDFLPEEEVEEEVEEKVEGEGEED